MVRGLGLLAAGLATAVLAASPATAANGNLRKAGNLLTIALPVSALGVSLLKNDWRGLGEFVVSAGLTVGSAYALREIVRIRRPDGSDFRSFTPPDLALADSAGDYLWDRYGWKYGVPAYAARFLVSYALSDEKKNHWYDTAASAALAYGFNYALVSRYHERPVRVSFDPEPNGASLHLVFRF